jgi:hypothetical protein
MACNVVGDFPNLMENPYLTIFQELFILIGTTYADGVLLIFLNRFVQMLLASLFYFWFLLEK